MYEYNTTTCTGALSAPKENVETAFPCTLVGASGESDDTVISAGSFLEYNYVSAANTNVYLNFGVFASLMLVVTQLWKN
jgi:hypothetical protein